MAEIGEPQREIDVQPAEAPVPKELPVEPPERAPTAPPEPVPA